LKTGAGALFLDFDGTLADTLPGMEAGLKLVCEKIGKPWSPTLFEHYQGFTLAEISADLITQIKNPPLSAAALTAFYKECAAKAYRSSAPTEGAQAVLSTCNERAIPCWIVTSSSRELVEIWLNAQSIRSRISGLVCGEDVKEHKPHPAAYSLAMRLAGADPARSLAVEDSTNGVKSAESAGLSTLFFSPLGRKPPGKSRLIRNFSEILGLLEAAR
jgi:HAD superfamily hydrolase (TIGR01509 family)